MSRKDIIRHAKDVIAARRTESIDEYEAHTALASSKIPGFAELDKQISQTGIKIFGSSMGKNDNSKNIELIKSEYDTLVNKKRALLTQNGFSADYCDIKYRCAKCSDTGYVDINICDCLKKEIVFSSLENSGLYSLVQNQSFSSFTLDFYKNDDKILMAQNLDLLKEFADSFVPGRSDSFLFIGGTGLGKTHLSSAVAKRVIEKGAYVVYDTALNMFGEFETRRFGSNSYSADSDNDDIDRYQDCDLLIIDDLGCELTNQFTVSCLYSILNTRIIKHKSTIISTNLTQTELRKRYSDRIISRIFGEFKPLLFRGSDIREQKIR